jgi:hypothetical protein
VAKSKRELLKERVFARGELPTQAEFVAELFELAGGPRSLAKYLWTEINKPDASPILKARTLELLLRNLKSIADKAKPPSPEDLTDEELESFINTRLESLKGD